MVETMQIRGQSGSVAFDKGGPSYSWQIPALILIHPSFLVFSHLFSFCLSLSHPWTFYPIYTADILHTW